MVISVNCEVNLCCSIKHQVEKEISLTDLQVPGYTYHDRHPISTSYLGADVWIRNKRQMNHKIVYIPFPRSIRHFVTLLPNLPLSPNAILLDDKICCHI